MSRNALMKILKRLGHDVQGAESARSALDKMSWKPEVIVLDLMLPDGLGIAVLQHIRTTGMRTRVAILTGVAHPETIAEILEYEPDAIFEKPLDLEALSEWMRTGVCPG